MKWVLLELYFEDVKTESKEQATVINSQTKIETPAAWCQVYNLNSLVYFNESWLSPLTWRFIPGSL